MKAQRNEVNAVDDPETEARASGKGTRHIHCWSRPAGVCQRVFRALVGNSGDHCIGQTIQGRPERSCATVFAYYSSQSSPRSLRVRDAALEVIPAADHFQIDVEVNYSLPASGQWLHGGNKENRSVATNCGSHSASDWKRFRHSETGAIAGSESC